LKDPDPKVRMQALAAVSAIGVKAKPFVQLAVQEALDDPDPSIAMTAIATLVHLHSDESIPALQKIMNDKKASQIMRETAEEAVDQLKLISSKTKEK
jgi:HEAT repeat protein